MINLLQLSDRYKDVGLGYIRFGGHAFYEINSDVSCQLNDYGGKEGFILDGDGCVELFSIDTSAKWTWYKDGVEISADEYEQGTENMEWEEEKASGFTYKTNSTKKWKGLTLDKYFPHPWYPEKEIIAFVVVNPLPGVRSGETMERDTDGLFGHNLGRVNVNYPKEYCLFYPEFFRPIYKE